MSKSSPCKDCPERFIACSDRCPKDARGEYGYKAWKAELNAANEAERLQKSIAWTNARLRRARWAKIKGEHYGAYKEF